MSQKKTAPGVVILLDILLINIAFWLSYLLRYQLGFPYQVQSDFYTSYIPFIPYAGLVTLLCLLSYFIDGLYEARRGRRFFDEFYRLLTGTMTGIVIMMAITFFLQPRYYSRGMLILAGALIVALLGAARIGHRLIQAAQRRRGIHVAQVLIVGAGETGRAVMRSILANPSTGYQIIGYVDDDPAKGNGELGRIQGLGEIEQIKDIILKKTVDEVIVTLPWTYHRRILQIVEECEREDIRVHIVPDVFQQRMHRIDMESLHGIPLISAGAVEVRSGVLLIKRIIDLLLTIIALPFLAILFVVVAVVIRLDSPGPIIFKHRRVGKGGKEFDVFKFRSMIDGAEAMQDQLADRNITKGITFKDPEDPRVTRIGWFLRHSSIDEFPQLINVLRGEMSLVGPRPGTPKEVEDYEHWQHKRLSVRPGITGLWQVSGRSNVPFAEMCLLDIFYIENWSLDLDVRILFQTIPRVLLRDGAH